MHTKNLCAIATAVGLIFATATSAFAACSQAELGTSATPYRWSIYGVAPSGDWTECLVWVRGKFNVTGKCRRKAATTYVTIEKAASFMSLTTDCVLSGELERVTSPAFRARLSKGYKTNYPGGFAGTLVRDGSSEQHQFTMYRIQ